MTLRREERGEGRRKIHLDYVKRKRHPKEKVSEMHRVILTTAECPDCFMFKCVDQQLREALRCTEVKLSMDKKKTSFLILVVKKKKVKKPEPGNGE